MDGELAKFCMKNEEEGKRHGRGQELCTKRDGRKEGKHGGR